MSIRHCADRVIVLSAALRLQYTGFMIRVAVLQMVSTNNRDENLAVAADLIQQAAEDDAKLLLLPENFSFMGQNEHDKVALREKPGSGPVQDFLQQQAKHHGLWLIGGTVPLTASVPDKIRAASLLYNPDGECIARYDKIHLFDVHVKSGGDDTYNESGTIEGGDEIIVARTPIGKIGLSVCYDLRFPELYRSMHSHDVNIFAVPAAFTATTGKAHWEVLLRSRAIENLCYLLASNQSGEHVNKRRTWGHSMIVNPWGEVLAVVERDTGFACADIDLQQLEKLRGSFPALKHCKPDIY
ncbi:MAG TPA: carbon-nitrogen hydrolase family protein [Gammaproteobacteria bacterium]|nr:carbon-nitrogen hydrolase family protein [Gammaproteobacteria bacterium]